MPTPNVTPWKDQLRQERIKRNWKQCEVAERLGTTTITVNRWEKGKQQPCFYFRAKLSALFGKSMEELGLVESRLSSLPMTQEKALISTAMGSTPTNIPLLSTVPSRRNPFFTGREAVLSQLHVFLSRNCYSEASQTCTISGLGGIGKTEVAIEYAYRYANDYMAIFWINAETFETLLSSFIAIATLLHLPKTEERDQKSYVVPAVLSWLQNHTRCLLIFDNVEDVELLQTFLPTMCIGSLLFITRKQTLGISAHILKIDKMTAEESLHFLLCRSQRFSPTTSTHPTPAEQVAIQEIFTKFDGLPLALDQAAAYIEETQCRLTDYLQLFRSSPLSLLEKRGISSGHPVSVIKTFMFTFERIKEQHTHAATLLILCAFLASENIPESFLLKHMYLLDLPCTSPEEHFFLFQDMIQTLLGHSFIQRNHDKHILSIHPLLQTILINSLAEPVRRLWRERILHALKLTSLAEYDQPGSQAWCQQILL